MSIIIKEYLDSDIKNTDANQHFSLTEDYRNLNTVSENSLMVDIEGIHVGPTRNYTWYTEKALKDSIPTWTKPYERPLILHHNEKDGKIIGRILNAEYTTRNTRSGTGALIFSCNIPDEEGKNGVKDGRLKTTSIGVLAHDVRCSICGQIITEDGECEHERGMKYDDETCYWMIYKMEAKELSYVIVPSDIYASNIKIYSTKASSLKENFKEEGELCMAKTTTVEEKETVIDEKIEVKTKEEEKEQESETETLKATILELQKTIKELEDKVKKYEKDATEEKKMRENAEGELVRINKQLKEFAIEQILVLRNQLKRPVLAKEKLENRSQESLMDSILDLKEELNIDGNIPLAEENDDKVKEDKIDIKENIEEIKENENEAIDGNNVEESIFSIEKPQKESLIDKGKDVLSKNMEEKEKNFALNVKENEEDSNNNYEEELNYIKNYYKL